MEYRNYLRDHYEWNKREHRFFSYRYIALKTGLDASFYVKVLNTQKHIAEGAIPALVEFLKFNKRESEYFTTLVHFNKAKHHDQERLYFEKLLSLRTPPAKTLEKDAYDYFSSWHNIVLREELNVVPFKGNFADIAGRLLPAITPAQARQSIRLIEKLGLIRRDEQGVYRLTDQFITTDGISKTIAVKSFQKEVCKLGMEAIDRVPKSDRDITTLTVSTTRSCLEEIRERLTEVRQEIMEIVRKEDKAEDVYQINFQVFPLTRNNPPGAR
jgi:uncharacterized protein (TIGR02147 family)